MDNPKTQIVDRIKQANNVLVTVSANPSVDQLSAAIGLTLMLNKLGKHGTAVFSGKVPSTIEFLEPEKTLEKTTDSLRDFIIALDKSKADKLRYKVEENIVKIFITPYKTSISENDLNFSEGDFNVDVVVALGVAAQTDLDQAITANGRILHDATVISINNGPGGELGGIHWLDEAASSLSEMVFSLSSDLDKSLLDKQIATALLTGIVAETERFSNEKTSPLTMSVSAELMKAGANQQLVATKLQEKEKEPTPPEKPSSEVTQNLPQPPPGPGSLPTQIKVKPVEPPKPNEGTLEIKHEKPQITESEDETDKNDKEEPGLSQIHVDEQGNLRTLTDRQPAQPVQGPTTPPAPTSSPADNSRFVTQPPSLGGTLTANSRPEDLEPTTDALSMPSVDRPFLSHNADDGLKSRVPDEPPKAVMPTTYNETLTQLEKQIGSPHTDMPQPGQPVVTTPAGGTLAPQPATQNGSDLNQARSAVATAIDQNPAASATPLPPIAALNALPLYDLHDKGASTASSSPNTSTMSPVVDNFLPPTQPAARPYLAGNSAAMPAGGAQSNPVLSPQPNPVAQVNNQTSPLSPPPVPPPMVPFS
jgi:hypothetical protein